MTDPADVIAKCPRCGTLFAVPAHADVTDELFEIAKLAGALDLVREVVCRKPASFERRLEAARARSRDSLLRNCGGAWR